MAQGNSWLELGYAIGSGLKGMWNGAQADSKADEDAYNAWQRQVYLQKLQQDWAEHMSSTAHQREVKDLVEAGLNPILSANNGAPMGSASAPSVAMSESSKRYIEGNQLGQQAMANAINAYQARNNAKEIEEKIELMKSQGGLNQVNSELALANKMQVELDNVKKQLENEYLPTYQKQQLENMKSQYEEAISRIKANNASTARTQAEITNINALQTKAEEETELLKKEKQKREIEIERLKDTPTAKDDYGFKIGPRGIEITGTINRYGKENIFDRLGHKAKGYVRNLKYEEIPKHY